MLSQMSFRLQMNRDRGTKGRRDEAQPYHSAAQDWLPTEAKQGWAGQYLDGRPPGKTRLLLVEVLVRPAGGAHPVVCVGPNAPV